MIFYICILYNNPLTNRFVKLNSILGKRTLKNYLQEGGTNLEQTKVVNESAKLETNRDSLIKEIIELCDEEARHRPSKLTNIINKTNVWKGSEFAERHIYYMRQFIKKSVEEYVTKLPEINDVFNIIQKILEDYKGERIIKITELFKESWKEEGFAGKPKPVRPIIEYEWSRPLSNVVEKIVGEMYDDLRWVNDSEYEDDPDDPFPWEPFTP